MLPPRTQGYFLLLVQEKATKKKDTPDGATTTRASAVPGPGADLTRHPASKIRRGHPVRAPFGARARNLAVRGRAIRGPKKNQTPTAHAFVPPLLGEPLWARAAKPVLLIMEVLIKSSFRRRPESKL